jgi:hypothetical protein
MRRVWPGGVLKRSICTIDQTGAEFFDSMASAVKTIRSQKVMLMSDSARSRARHALVNGFACSPF